MKETLNCLFLNAAFKYAKVIHVMEKKRGSFETALELADAAHRVVVSLIGSLPKAEADALSTSTQIMLDVYAKQHGLKLTELADNAH